MAASFMAVTDEHLRTCAHRVQQHLHVLSDKYFFGYHRIKAAHEDCGVVTETFFQCTEMHTVLCQHPVCGGFPGSSTAVSGKFRAVRAFVVSVLVPALVFTLLVGAVLFLSASASTRRPDDAIGILPPQQSRRSDFSPVTHIDVVTVCALGDAPQLQSSTATWCQFFDFSGVRAWYLVVPDVQVKFFRDLARGMQCAGSSSEGLPSPPFRVVPESSLIPAFTVNDTTHGYVRQVLLKLAAAYLVTEPFYLVLDSDIYVRRPSSITDFFDADMIRAKVDLEPDAGSNAHSWYTESERVLQTDIFSATSEFCATRSMSPRRLHRIELSSVSANSSGFTQSRPNGPETTNSRTEAGYVVDPARPFALVNVEYKPGADTVVYGFCGANRVARTLYVTPMMLHRDVVRVNLVGRLTALYPSLPWWQSLLDYQHRRYRSQSSLDHVARAFANIHPVLTWSEYALYFLSAVLASSFDDYYAVDVSASTGGLTSIEHSVSVYSEWYARNFADIFRDQSDARPLFVIHSWMHIPVHEINSRLAPYVDTIRTLNKPQVPPPTRMRELLRDLRTLP